MGGDTVKDVVIEEESSRSLSPSPRSCCFSDDLRVSEENIPKFSNLATDLRRREKSYQEILQSYEKLSSKRKLKLARCQILSYTPGSWADFDLSDYDVPKKTSIIIVGPKGAGKSRLVNRISRVIENDELAPPRAQESYGTLSKGGTFFVQEYMIPRGSASFCLYDTRGLSQISSSDNTSKIEQWITKGVHHGEPVIWTSDNSDLRDRLIRDGCTGCEISKVNSVIFVVNAVEILKSMESEMSYAHMVSTSFNCPLLSFKDDKPAVVMTHGDILLREERARVRVFLGELLGIPPDKQIFDIPESQDTATELTVCNLVRHSLEHADKNLRFLPKRKFTLSKVEGGVIKRSRLLMLSNALTLLLALAIIYSVGHHSGQNAADEAQHKLNIFKSPQLYNHTVKPIRRMWPRPVVGPANHAHVENLKSEPVSEGRSCPQMVVRRPRHAHGRNHKSKTVSEGEPSIDWRIARSLWLDEEKRSVGKEEANPSFDWRSIRHLWYVE